MTDEEQRIALQEKNSQIEIMQQDLVDYITNNDGTIIKQLEFINSVYANIPVELITKLENRDDILTMEYYDKDAKSTSMSNGGDSFKTDDTIHNTDIKNLWSVKITHDDIILDFEIPSEDDKSVLITIPNYIVLEEFDITVNDKIVDYSIAQGNDKSILLITLQNDDTNNSINILTPIQQLAQDVSPSDIECKDGLELIFKFSDGSPACVKPKTVEKLIQRGWAIL